MVKTPYTGLWIRDHLNEVGEDYIQHMSTLYRREMKKTKRVVSSYHQFCKMIFVLKSLNLLEFIREEESNRSWLTPRRYYRIKPGKEKSLKWQNPQKHYTSKTA
jgi:hypothetical protein